MISCGDFRRIPSDSFGDGLPLVDLVTSLFEPATAKSCYAQASDVSTFVSKEINNQACI